MMKTILFSLASICILILLSCSTDEEPIIEELSQEELDFISDILLVEDEMDGIWNGFDCVREYPIFIIISPDQGVFLNPPASQMENSQTITSQIDDLPMFRNNEMLEVAKEIIGNAVFSFGNYEDFSFYIFQLVDPVSNFYSDYKNRNGHFHISIFFHELFHVFATLKHNDQYFSENREQNFNGYPLTEETLPLLLLLFDVMVDAYHQDNDNQKLKYLEYYVSIQQALEEADNTPNKLSRNHGFYQEKSEGTARYIEIFSTLNALNNNTIDDPTHGYGEFAENITTGLEARQVYAWRIFYHTGAGAIHLLKELGHPNLEASFLVPTDTPFDIAKSFLGMNSSETEAALNEVKALYNWQGLVDRADYLLGLL